MEKYIVYIAGIKNNLRGDFYNKETAVRYAQSLLDEFPEDPNLEVVISRKLGPVKTNDDDFYVAEVLGENE